MEQLIIDTLEQYFTSGEYQYCEPNISPTEYRTILADLKRLEQIEQIVERFKSQYDHTSNLDLMVEIKEVLEQENMDKTCDNCKYHSDAEEIHGKTPCGTCEREFINFCRKE